MNRAAAIISLGAISIVSMDLALAIVLEKKRHLGWTRWFIVFLSSLLGLSILFNLDLVSAFFWEGTVRRVMRLIWQVFFLVDSSFLCVFSVLFSSWLIAVPLSFPLRFLDYALGTGYLVSSILGHIYGNRLLYVLRYLFATLVVFYIVLIILVNYRKIEGRRVKVLCLTLIIIAFSTIPLLVLAMVFPSMGTLSLSILGLAFFIAFLVFLFLAVNVSDEKVKKDTELENARKYGITNRELEVVKLIKQGLTNKEIASALSISVNTVNNHVANLFSKTATRSRIDLLNLLKEAAW